MSENGLKTWIFPAQRLHCWCRSHSCVCWCLLEDAGLVICWLHCRVLYCDSTLPPATHRVSDYNIHTDLEKCELVCIFIKMSRHAAPEWRHLLLFTSCLGLLLTSRDWSLLRSQDALEKKAYQVICFWHIRKTHFKFCKRVLNNCEEEMTQLTCSGFLWIWGAIFLLVFPF